MSEATVLPLRAVLRCVKENCSKDVIGHRINSKGQNIYLCQEDFRTVYMALDEGDENRWVRYDGKKPWDGIL